MANRPGRKSKRTPTMQDKLSHALRLGASRRLACQYAGISEDTFARYLVDADFADMVNKAEGSGAIQWLNKIEKAANDGNWQAAAWKLERRYPHEYGRQVQEVEQSGSMTIKIEYTNESKPD